MSEFLDEILEWYNKYIEEVQKVKEYYKGPEHSQYIEGALYVTQPQYTELYRHFSDLKRVPLTVGEPPKPLAEIPVIVMKNNEVKCLPSGKVLVYSKLLESFYVFDPKIAESVGIRSQLPKMD